MEHYLRWTLRSNINKSSLQLSVSFFLNFFLNIKYVCKTIQAYVLGKQTNKTKNKIGYIFINTSYETHL